MENRVAKVVNDDKKYYLELQVNNGTTNIPITEENQTIIMESFNRLLIDLKSGLFSYQLDKNEDNLYYQVSSEYIKLLNIELKNIHTQMTKYNLVQKNDPVTIDNLI